MKGEKEIISDICMVLSQVHVVKDATRGATLEVVVSRMKTVNAYRTAQNPQDATSMRFVAVSATIPNITDVSPTLTLYRYYA